jgi:hypothetical protein
LKLINLQDYPNHKDISHIESVVCDNAIVDDEDNPRIREEVIKMGQLFESLDTIKFFLGLHCTIGGHKIHIFTANIPTIHSIYRRYVLITNEFHEFC